MASEEPTSVVRRYIEEVWHKSNLAAVDEFLAPSYRRYVSPVATTLTRKGQKERLAAFRAAFPDSHLTIEDMLAEGDRVAFRSTIRATHRAEYLGIPATGRSVTISLIDVVRIEHGQIVEHWGGPDFFDLLRQLSASISSDEEKK